MTAELVTIASDTVTAQINPFGAELWSLTDAQGREFMTDADPAFWTGHAPVLFPIVGELAGGHYRLGDQTHALARHGFARRSAFELVEHEGHIARFRLCDSPESRGVYPFAFVLELAYRIHGARLEIEAVVRNPGETPLPFSLGFHPGFAWPLPDGGDKLAHTIVFERDEPGPLLRLNDKGLFEGREPSPVRGDTLALAPELFARDALVWDDLASRSVVYRGESGPGLRIDFPDTPHLGVWQKPGAGFLCIEPWHGHADAEGFTGDFRDKPGVIALPAGEVRSFRVDVTVI
jgi:galactose mutarotase-like enzyme